MTIDPADIILGSGEQKGCCALHGCREFLFTRNDSGHPATLTAALDSQRRLNV